MAQTVQDDRAYKLIIIELFFLMVGLLVAAFLCYLIWQSWRKKKVKEKR